MARRTFDSDGESVDMKPTVKRKRKQPESSPPPQGRDKAPRRSGRVRRPPSPLEISGESGHKPSDSRRARKSIELSPSPEMISSPIRDPPPPPARKPQTAPRTMGNSVQDMFDSLEHDLRTEQERSQRQLREIEKLKQQLQAKDKTQTGARSSAPVPPGKRDKVLEGKDNEIRELEDSLKTCRDLRNASRLALDTRDKELQKLRQKHKSLVKAANTVANKWGGMDELAQAVEDAEE